MAHPHGYPAGQRAWARARLTRGSSTGEVWEIGSEYPEARLSIGADASAGWPIQAAGVQPVHCELFWDGQSLWVADSYGAGGVFLDGARVADWVQIQGPAELRFGHASLDLETSAPAHLQMASSPSAARPVTLTDMVAPPERRSQPIFGGAANDESIPDLDAAATRVVASPVAELDAERTRVASAHAPPQSANLRPRLGGAPTAESPEATRMVAMPVPPASASALPQHGLSPAPVIAPPPAAPSFGQAPPAFAPAAPAQLPAMPDPSIAPAMAAPPVDAGGGFVGPPVDPNPVQKKTPIEQIREQIREKLQVLKPQSSAEVLAASGGGKKGQTIPTRTWIMLGVTVAAAMGLLFWEAEPAEVAAPQQQAQAQGGTAPVAVGSSEAPTPPQPTPSQPTPSQPTPPQPTPPEPTVAPVAVADPSPAAPDGSQPADGEAQAGPTMQRQAADHYITGRYPEALVLYRQLAAQSPQDPAYASMVRILERRVQCTDGVGPGGAPCVE